MARIYHDKKIMQFDVSKGYSAFIKMFTDEDIRSMRRFLEVEGNIPDNNEELVIEYIRERLIENIRDGRTRCTEQLFNILFKMK